MVQVTGIDHVVLHVADARRSVEWYRDKLGMQPERFDEFERGEVFFPSVRVDECTIIDLLEVERTGENVNHLCFTIERTDLDVLVASGELDVAGTPSELWGAQGIGHTIYVLDPDGNTIELRYSDA